MHWALLSTISINEFSVVMFDISIFFLFNAAIILHDSLIFDLICFLFCAND